ncbi:MAG: hypothetical protein WC307_05225 [Candidatus Nanoarchaeia archaeon]|jgi:hypothetical protein
MNANAYFGSGKDSIDSVDEDYSFTKSFSDLGIHNGQQYAGAIRGDVTKVLKTSDLIKKAGTMLSTDNEYASSTNFSTTSGNLPNFPIYYIPEMIDYTAKAHPFWAMLPKVAMRGKFVVFDYKSAKGSAAFKYEDPALDESKPTVAKKIFQVKTAYATRAMSNLDIRVNEGYRNKLNEAMMDATDALLDLLEQALFTGDASTNAYEFSGLDILITTNTEDQSAAELTIPKIREAIRWAKQGAKTSVAGTGMPSLIITNNVDFDKIKELIQPWLRYNDTNILSWGIESYKFDGIPVIANPFANITSGSRRLYVLDMRQWEMATLQDITYAELPQDGDRMKFFLKFYGVLNCKAELFNSMLYGIGA